MKWKMKKDMKTGNEWGNGKQYRTMVVAAGKNLGVLEIREYRK